MNIQPLIFFDLVIAIFILAISLLIVVIASHSGSLRSSRRKKEQINLESQASGEIDKILEDAKANAIKIVEEANKKSWEIINNAQLFQSSSKNTLDKELKTLAGNQALAFGKLSSDFLKIYQKDLDEVKNKNIELFKSISNNIESYALTQISDFKKIISKETVDAQKIVEGKIEEAYTQAQKEIEEYRSSALKKVDDNIYQILEKVSKLVLGEALSLRDHEKLIIDALSKAKADGLK